MKISSKKIPGVSKPFEKRLESVVKLLKDHKVCKSDVCGVPAKKLRTAELLGARWIQVEKLVRGRILPFGDFLRVVGNSLVKVSTAAAWGTREGYCAELAKAVAVYVHQIAGDDREQFLNSPKGLILRSIAAACFEGLLRGNLGKTEISPLRRKRDFVFPRIDAWHKSLEARIKSSGFTDDVNLKVSCGTLYFAPGTSEREKLEREAENEVHPVISSDKKLDPADKVDQAFQIVPNESGSFG